MSKITRGILNLLGFTSLLLGILGIFLPGLPTTPFLILATYLFSKSSEKIHGYILNYPYFGKILSDWERSKIISRKAKFQAILSILLVFSFSIFSLKMNPAIGVVGLVIILFIASRPSRKITS